MKLESPTHNKKYLFIYIRCILQYIIGTNFFIHTSKYGTFLGRVPSSTSTKVQKNSFGTDCGGMGW
jgi:hypothetical protein